MNDPEVWDELDGRQRGTTEAYELHKGSHPDDLEKPEYRTGKATPKEIS